MEALIEAERLAQVAADRKARNDYEVDEDGFSDEVYCSKQGALDAAQHKFDALRAVHTHWEDEDDEDDPYWGSKVSIADGHYTWEKTWMADAIPPAEELMYVYPPEHRMKSIVKVWIKPLEIKP